MVMTVGTDSGVVNDGGLVVMTWDRQWGSE